MLLYITLLLWVYEHAGEAVSIAAPRGPAGLRGCKEVG